MQLIVSPSTSATFIRIIWQNEAKGAGCVAVSAQGGAECH
jgi:hypothetical protein